MPLATVFRLKRTEFPGIFEWVFRLFSAECFFADFIPRRRLFSYWRVFRWLDSSAFFFCNVSAGGVGIGLRTRIFDPVPEPYVGLAALVGLVPGPASTAPQGGLVSCHGI